ncbi:MAG: FlgD immunoglobulin-like domain containing protein [Candidatus Eisenbacteria bacterium]
MRLLLALSLAVVPASSALALDVQTRAVSPVLSWTESRLERFDPSWVHVKFREGMDVDLREGRFVQVGLADMESPLTSVDAVLDGALEVRRTFSGEKAQMREWKRIGERKSGQVGPDLSLWYDVHLPEGRANLADVLNELNALPEVEVAHPAPICETAVIRESVSAPTSTLPPTDASRRGGPLGASGSREDGAPSDASRAESSPLLRGSTPDFTAQQGYLGASPVGLDAAAAWAETGGRGESMRFLDVELGWILSHEDFVGANQFYQSGTIDPAYTDHGTAVLGEVVGADNGYGVTGFANEAEWGVVAIAIGDWPTVPQYFQDAVDNLDAGDVWLIELQMYPPGRDATPMEWLQVNYDVIWTSCWARDIVCVEAGANGSQDLDSSVWSGVFDRSVRDSGAILVAAGTPTGRVAEWFTNYGSRMDVHAWGSQIVTTGYGNLYNGGTSSSWYTNNFGGTSGASPMVTGASLCVQGVAKARFGAPLTPPELRALLADTGAAHLDASKEIGPRPDLSAALVALADPASVPNVGSSDPVRPGGLEIRSPFADGTEIRFDQRVASAAHLDVLDASGRLLRTVDLGVISVGASEVHWDGKDSRGREVGSGVYWLRLRTEHGAAAGRAVKVN